MGRISIAACAVTAALLLVPAGAGAAKVTLSAGGELVYSAKGTEANNLTIAPVGGSNALKLTELGSGVPLQGSARCSVAASVAVCTPAAGHTVVKITVEAGDGADRVTNDSGTASLMRGGAGRDTLVGGSGRDQIYGGIDDDQLFGRLGNDDLYGEADNDSFELTGAPALVPLGPNGDGVDYYDGGADFDNWASFYGRHYGTYTPVGTMDTQVWPGELGQTIDFGFANNADRNTVVGMEQLLGSQGNDRLIGTSQDEVLYSLGGNDLLEGNGGADFYECDGSGTPPGAGRYGAGGSDVVDYHHGRIAPVTVSLDDQDNDGSGGGAEKDNVQRDCELLLGTDAGGDVFAGGAEAELQTTIGFETVTGGAGNDTLTTFGATTVSGGEGNDTLAGGTLVNGDAGDDTLAGTEAVNWLSGGGGNDSLAGAGGDDLLVGGDGNDTMLGQEGADQLYSRDPSIFAYWSDSVDCGSNPPGRPDLAQVNTQTFADLVTGCEQLLP